MERTKKQIANTAFWIAALRSGQYQQTTEHLTTVDEDGTNPRHCCLGVACVIMGKVGTVRGTAVTYDGKNDEWGDDEFYRTFGFYNQRQCILVDMNDAGAGFHDIADYLESTNTLTGREKV